ncbi:MAG TPA: flagellar motor protein MotB [Magnetovibrio sp.]
MDTQIAPPEHAGDQTIALFLGLYLVVLAFFILLVSISTLEEAKSQKVMDSLSSAFTSIVPPSADLQSFKAKDGDVLAGQEFQQQVTGIFATELGIDKVQTVQPGRQMRLILSADSLFFQGEARIRPAMYPLLDRTVAALSNRPTGLRYDLEFVIGTPTLADGKTMPIAQTLEVSRAGAFARAMFERGIPPDSVSVGMRPGHVGEVIIWFYTRDIEADKLRFDDAVQKKN